MVGYRVKKLNFVDANKVNVRARCLGVQMHVNARLINGVIIPIVNYSIDKGLRCKFKLVGKYPKMPEKRTK